MKPPYYFIKSKPISRDFEECVIQPDDIKSTPDLAIFATFE
jgi:hypothetical protein